MEKVDGDLIKDLRAGEGFIEEVVKQQLEIIDAAALTALEEQKPYAIITLADYFNIPYMNPGIARNKVYFNVCRNLEKRHIKFKLLKPKKWCKICIQPLLPKHLDGNKCKKCGREPFIPRDAKYKLVIFFQSKEEEEENDNIAEWLNKHSF